MHTVSAPAGGGKTSFSYALIFAVTRYAESNPDAPYGCVFVVDQITKADEVYRELNALLPGKVAIWTTDHDVDCKKPKKIDKPAAQFSRDQLRLYPVIVVTHAFYNWEQGATMLALLSAMASSATTGHSRSWMSGQRK